MANEVQSTGGFAGGTGSGVSQIVAGTNITISPLGGTGIVTINATGGSSIAVVANFSALPAVGTVTGQFFWASAAQGSKWLPGALGGTYYSAGMYYSNGVSYEFMDVPYQATQAEVNTGTNTDKFVTPATLSSWTSPYVPYTGATTTVDLGTQKILVGNGSAAAPSIGISSAPTSGFWKNGTYGALNWGSGGTFGGLFEASGLYVKATGILAFLGSDLESASADVVLKRDAANILSMGVATGAAAQTFRIYGTNTGNKYLNLTHDGTDALITANSGVVKIAGITITASTGVLTLGSNTLTLAGNFTTTGSFNTTIAQVATGTYTLPASTSTLASLTLAEAFTNKTITASTNTIGGVTMGLGSDAVGDIYTAGTSNVLNRIAAVAAGSYLRSAGTTTKPVWSTLILPNAATANYIAYATATNTWGESSKLTFDGTKFQVASGTITGTGGLANFTGTMPTSIGGNTYAFNTSVTSAGSSGQTNGGVFFEYLPGYTGSAPTVTLSAENSVLGTGNDLRWTTTVSNPFANAAFNASTYGVTTGANIGGAYLVQGGVLNVGVLGRSAGVKNSGTNIGIIGHGRNTGTSPIQIGGYFTLQNGAPTYASCALCADNGDQTSPIFLARDNGTVVHSIIDGGQSFFGGATTPTSWVHLAAGTATAGTAPLGFTSGVNLTVAVAGKMEFTTDDFYLTGTTGPTRKTISDLSYRAITALRTLDGSDELVNCTANTFTVTLPTAVGYAKQYTIVNSGTGIITIATTSAQTISGVASAILTLVQWDTIVLRSDGANWIKIN